MPKKAGIIFVMTGIVLIISALSLFYHNDKENKSAGQDAEILLAEMQSIIVARETSCATTAPTETVPVESTDPTMTVVEIEGYGYVGYLTIPVLELTLPVMDEWDDSRLKIAPCRHFGSVKTNDFVIAAHNYKNHFGYLSELKPGDAVVFTDMEGMEIFYEVEVVDTLNPTQVEAVQNSGYDLVLYTCTYSGKTRVAVFCNRK